jgi:hypothetical protein
MKIELRCLHCDPPGIGQRVLFLDQDFVVQIAIWCGDDEGFWDDEPGSGYHWQSRNVQFWAPMPKIDINARRSLLFRFEESITEIGAARYLFVKVDSRLFKELRGLISGDGYEGIR